MSESNPTYEASIFLNMAILNGLQSLEINLISFIMSIVHFYKYEKRMFFLRKFWFFVVAAVQLATRIRFIRFTSIRYVDMC